jgi:hypothetical protein
MQSLLDRSSLSQSFFDPPVEDLEVVKHQRFNHSQVKMGISKNGYAIQNKKSEMSGFSHILSDLEQPHETSQEYMM